MTYVDMTAQAEGPDDFPTPSDGWWLRWGQHRPYT